MDRKSAWWLIAGGLGLLLLSGGVYMATRGLRNDNPGNIRKTGDTWLGLAPPAAQTDPAFFIFTDPVFGLRAIARITRNHFNAGAASIADLINLWAPPTENDTGAYVAAVASHVGIDPMLPISDIDAVMPSIVTAIVQQENGLQPYSDAQIARALSLETTT